MALRAVKSKTRGMVNSFSGMRQSCWTHSSIVIRSIGVLLFTGVKLPIVAPPQSLYGPLFCWLPLYRRAAGSAAQNRVRRACYYEGKMHPGESERDPAGTVNLVGQSVADLRAYLHT